MYGGLSLKAEIAKAVVEDKYPNAIQVGMEQDAATCIIIDKEQVGRKRYLSGYCKTFAAAWISAEKRIKKGNQK